MRSFARVTSLAAVLASVALSVAAATIDLDDFDSDVMQAMDDAYKDLQPVIGAGNAEAATADAQVLLEGYQWTEEYFAGKAEASDAVQWAQEGRAQVRTVLTALEKQDFDAAAATAREAGKNCKACHQAYKTSLSR